MRAKDYNFLMMVANYFQPEINEIKQNLVQNLNTLVKQKFKTANAPNYYSPNRPTTSTSVAVKQQPVYTTDEESSTVVVVTSPARLVELLASRNVHIVSENIHGEVRRKKVTDNYDVAKQVVDSLLIHKNLPLQVTDEKTQSCLWGDPAKYSVSLDIYPLEMS